MKKHIYLLEFNDGTIIVENNRTCLKNKIYDWCSKNGEYHLTDNQIDTIVYNRLKNKPKYIKYFGKSCINDLFDIDESKIKTTHTNNRPLTPNYVLQLKRKYLNNKFQSFKENPNSIDRNKLQTIMCC